MTRISAGPYRLDLPPNGVAILYKVDGAGVDHQLPDGNGRIVWADRVPEVGNTLTGYFNGWRVYDVTPQAFGARLPVACVN